MAIIDSATIKVGPIAKAIIELNPTLTF